MFSIVSPSATHEKEEWNLAVMCELLETQQSYNQEQVCTIAYQGSIRSVAKSWMYSKINLQLGYHQLRMKAEDVHKMAFNTHYGQYKFIVMLLWFTNALTIFMDLMNLPSNHS